MPSKMSWFNREIVFQIGRSVGWISIVYFLVLFFMMPLEIFMRVSNENFYYNKQENLFQLGFEIQMVSMLVIPVLLAVFLFRFLHVKPAADLMHSLPVKRDKIYHHYALSGLFLLIIPILLNALILGILRNTLDVGAYFGNRDIAYWLTVTLLMNILVYLAGVFVGMFTGISAVQGVLAYIFLLFPAGISVLLVYNLKFFLNGFPYEYYLAGGIEKISPLTTAIELNYKPFTTVEMSVYAGLAFVFYWLALFVYKKRKVESVSQAIAFRTLIPVFKYGTATCMLLLGGLYFGQLQQNPGWLIFGYIAGSMIGYFIAEMVIQKSWRVIGSIKGYFIYAAGLFIAIAVMQFGFSSYEKSLPDLKEIEKVVLTDNPYMYLNEETTLTFSLKDPVNIQAVYKLHEQIAKKNNEIQGNEEYLETAFFLYELKNGKKFIRQFQINRVDLAAYYKPILESEEYKRGTNEIFGIDDNQAAKLTITPTGPVSRRAVIAEQSELIEAMEILKEEIETQTYEEMIAQRVPEANIEILLAENKTINMEWKPSYKKFENWLAQKGYLEDAKVMPDDVSYVLVLKTPKGGTIINDAFYTELKKNKEALKITDKKEIEQGLDRASWIEGKYLAAFFFKGQEYPDIRYFDDKSVPDIVTEQFKD